MTEDEEIPYDKLIPFVNNTRQRVIQNKARTGHRKCPFCTNGTVHVIAIRKMRRGEKVVILHMKCSNDCFTWME